MNVSFVGRHHRPARMKTGMMRYWCKCGCYFGSVRELTEHVRIYNQDWPRTSEDDEHKRITSGEYWAKAQKALSHTARDGMIVPKTPFKWKADLCSAANSAYNAQLGDVIYYVISRDYGHPAYLEVRGQNGGLKRLDLGNYNKIEQAKQACERHYAAGCDLSRAKAVKRST
jgi:hypothetical protein